MEQARAGASGGCGTFLLRTCHGTALVADPADDSLRHAHPEGGAGGAGGFGGAAVRLLRLADDWGVLVREDGRAMAPEWVRGSGLELGGLRLLPCRIEAEEAGAGGVSVLLRLPGDVLLTALPGGACAVDRHVAGAWERLVLARADADRNDGRYAALMADAGRFRHLAADPFAPPELIAALAGAVPRPELRASVPALAGRGDYARIFPWIRLALSEGAERSVWHTRAHLAAGIAAHGWEIGDHTYGAPQIIDGEYGRLVIGRYCSIAGEVRIVVANHATATATTYPFAALRRHWPGAAEDATDHVGEGVVIGHNVWIGVGATILPGARIGDGAIIGAAAVVAGKVPPYAVVVGNPARITRRRFDDAVIARLLALRWWDWPDHEVDRIVPRLLDGDVRRFLDAAEGVVRGDASASQEAV